MDFSSTFFTGAFFSKSISLISTILASLFFDVQLFLPLITLLASVCECLSSEWSLHVPSLLEICVELLSLVLFKIIANLEVSNGLDGSASFYRFTSLFSSGSSNFTTSTLPLWNLWDTLFELSFCFIILHFVEPLNILSITYSVLDFISSGFFSLLILFDFGFGFLSTAWILLFSYYLFLID